MAPALLLRGYRGKVRRGVERVPSPPGPGDASRFGDEGCLHARIGDAAVYVSPDRQSAAIQAASDGCRIAILDDGMQHRRLSRDIEIVSLPGDTPIGNGRLLPRGPLREGPLALARADLVVLAHAPEPTPVAASPRIPWVRPDVRILSWHDRITIAPLVSEGPAPSPGERVVLLCGIARPGPFRRAVEEAGYPVVAVEAFPDHHPFSGVECDAVRNHAARLGVRWIVTTAKDAVRLCEIVGTGERTIAVAALMIVWNEADAEAFLRTRLREIVRG
jgi:tetraacyldisaccharide 4'-kinase